jgi:hypothetical protein
MKAFPSLLLQEGVIDAETFAFFGAPSPSSRLEDVLMLVGGETASER